MTKLTVAEKTYNCQADETVLDTLLREGVQIPFGCKQGTCHSCLTRTVKSAPPEAAQKGLKDTQNAKTIFLPVCATLKKTCRLSYLIKKKCFLKALLSLMKC